MRGSQLTEEQNSETHRSDPHPPRRRRLRERRRFVLIGAVVAAVLAAAGLYTWQYYAIRESTDDARIDGHITTVSARVGGHVVAVNFEENEQVKAGAVLAQIDPQDYKVAVQRAAADLAAAEADVRAARTNVPIASANTRSQLETARAATSEAQAGVSVAENELQVARARLHAAEAALRQATADYNRAAKDLERYRQLVAKDEIPRQQFDAAVAAAAALDAAVDSARAGVAQAKEAVQASGSRVLQAKARVAQAESGERAAQTGPQQVQVTRAQAGSAEAAVEQRKAALEQARLNLEYTTVRAPVAGLIGQRSVELGQNVQPGQPLFSIVPVEKIWVTANFKETQLAHMRPGQRVLIDVDAYGGREYEGRIESIGAATGSTFSLLPAENASGNYVKVVQRVPVRIAIDTGQDPEHQLRPGMSVVPTVITK